MKSFIVNGSDPNNPDKFLAYMAPAPDEVPLVDLLAYISFFVITYMTQRLLVCY